MTAREFYGPAFDQLRLAEKQVLGEVRQGQKTWRDQGRSSPVLYTSSRIKSPDSMRRKLLLRGCPPTRQAALTQVRDAVGVRVICAFQNDVYLVAQWLEERPAFVVLETKDYISLHTATYVYINEDDMLLMMEIYPDVEELMDLLKDSLQQLSTWTEPNYIIQLFHHLFTLSLAKNVNVYDPLLYFLYKLEALLLITNDHIV